MYFFYLYLFYVYLMYLMIIYDIDEELWYLWSVMKILLCPMRDTNKYILIFFHIIMNDANIIRLYKYLTHYDK